MLKQTISMTALSETKAGASTCIVQIFTRPELMRKSGFWFNKITKIPSVPKSPLASDDYQATSRSFRRIERPVQALRLKTSDFAREAVAALLRLARSTSNAKVAAALVEKAADLNELMVDSPASRPSSPPTHGGTSK